MECHKEPDRCLSCDGVRVLNKEKEYCGCPSGTIDVGDACEQVMSWEDRKTNEKVVVKYGRRCSAFKWNSKKACKNTYNEDKTEEI